MAVQVNDILHTLCELLDFLPEILLVNLISSNKSSQFIDITNTQLYMKFYSIYIALVVPD